MEDPVSINDLPNETLLQIFQFLSIIDLQRVSLVCKRFKFLSDQEAKWIILAKKNYNVNLASLARGVKIRMLYQRLLYPFGPLLGLWQRQNFLFHGQLIKVYFRNEECRIVFEHLVVPQTLDKDISRETILSFGLDKKGEITLEEKGFLYYKIFKGKVSILTHQRLLFSEIPESSKMC